MFCSKCGKEVEENNNFCSHCGYELNPLKKESEATQVKEEPKEITHSKNNKTNVYILSVVCLLLFAVLIFKSLPSNVEEDSQDTYLELAENEVKDKIDANEDIPPVVKEIAKASIDKVDSKEELDKAIDTISDKVEKIGVEKEKIENLVEDLESYKDKKELKEIPNLETVYVKFIDFIDSLKSSFNLTNNSQNTASNDAKSSKNDTDSSKKETE